MKMTYRFESCPHCGFDLDNDGPNRFYCIDCGHSYYLNEQGELVDED